MLGRGKGDRLLFGRYLPQFSERRNVSFVIPYVELALIHEAIQNQNVGRGDDRFCGDIHYPPGGRSRQDKRQAYLRSNKRQEAQKQDTDYPNYGVVFI